MNRRFVLLLPMVIGCSDAAAPSALSSIDGMWDYAGERTVGSAPGTACSDTGTFTFKKTDGGWTGAVQSMETCRSGSLVTSLSKADSISSGSSTSERFTFVRSSLGRTCADTAVAVVGDPGSLNGIEHCDNSVISWHAVRGGPLASLVMPATWLITPGTRSTLDLVMRTAAGRRVFGRSVVWSSTRPDIAAISLGTLTGLMPGSASISATADGKTATTSVTVLPPTPLLAVAAGDAFTCALSADQRPYCWGNLTPYQQIPAPVQSSPALTSIAASQHSVCGISVAREVWCWGRNDSGQLGIGTTIDTTTPALVQASGRTFTSATSGGDHSCAIATDGHAWCWGANAQGQLGTGSLISSLVPVPVAGGYTFTALSAGDSHTCGVAVGGALYCWGNNAGGQLGDSTTTNRSTPTLVHGSHAFQSVSAGFVHTCGIVVGGAAWCWGRNNVGQFGDGTTTGADYPVPAANGLVLASISASLNYGCGVTTTGDIWCWGFKGTVVWGQLGDGGQTGSALPVHVSGALTWASVTTGVYLYSDESTNAGTAAQTCGVTIAGATWCWGSNLVGQLGVGTRTASYVPIRVFGQP